MRKLWLCAVGVTVCCFLLCGCLQIKERGSAGRPTAGTAETDQDAFSEYARVEAELAEQAQRISAFETRLAELEAKKGGDPSVTADPDVDMRSPSDPEELYRYTVSEDGYATITSYLGAEETAIIPSSLGGCPVVAVGDEAFKNGSVTSVVIPSGVRRVDWFAFGGCYRLTSVTVPDSVVAIGYGAFDLCAPTLSFVCSEGSYAAGYAKSYGIAVRQP